MAKRCIIAVAMAVLGTAYGDDDGSVALDEAGTTLVVQGPEAVSIEPVLKLGAFADVEVCDTPTHTPATGAGAPTPTRADLRSRSRY